MLLESHSTGTSQCPSTFLSSAHHNHHPAGHNQTLQLSHPSPPSTVLVVAAMSHLHQETCSLLEPSEGTSEGHRGRGVWQLKGTTLPQPLPPNWEGHHRSEEMVPASTTQADSYQATEILGSR